VGSQEIESAAEGSRRLVLMLINEDVHGQVTPDRAVELVDQIIEKEADE